MVVVGPRECPCVLGIILIHHFEKLWRRRRAQASQQSSRTAAGHMASWSRTRTERLDFINEELRRQGHAVKTFRDVDAAMQKYAQVTRHNLAPLGPEPQFSDFYHPSNGQKDREIAFVILGMAATGVVAYRLAK